jgi:hypothetical protein
VRTAIEYSKKFNPSHVMVVDADDCINQNIAKFVEEHPESDGWYARRGYVYKEGKRYIYLNAKNFNDLCGTSIIIRHDLATFLVTEGKYYDHTTVTLKNGKKLQPLPFAGSVYSVENQENYRMTATAVKALATKSYQKGLNYWLEKISKYRIFFLTNSIRQQFGLYKLEM